MQLRVNESMDEILRDLINEMRRHYIDVKER